MKKFVINDMSDLALRLGCKQTWKKNKMLKEIICREKMTLSSKRPFMQLSKNICTKMSGHQV